MKFKLKPLSILMSGSAGPAEMFQSVFENWPGCLNFDHLPAFFNGNRHNVTMSDFKEMYFTYVWYLNISHPAEYAQFKCQVLIFVSVTFANIFTIYKPV